MEPLLQDTRHALRRLAATPGFTAVAVLTLALALGANTIVFSTLNAVFFPPLGVVEPDRVVGVLWQSRLREHDITPLSYPEFRDLAAHDDLFASLCGTLTASRPLSVGGHTIAASAHLVTAGCFAVRGKGPLRGRFLGPEDLDQPTAVISEPLWRTRFGGRDEAIGATLRFGGREFAVVGVSPNAFPDVTVPFSWAPEVATLRPPTGYMADRRWRRVSVTARVRPGVTLEQVRARAPALTTAFAAADPTVPAERSIVVSQPYVLEPPREVAWLLALSGVVLLIACANLAGLLLARGTARVNELAVRLAIGASRARLVQQLLIESLLLALAGGAAGYVLTLVFAASLGFLDPPPEWQGVVNPRIDWRVLVFTLASAVATAVVFGLGPALRVTRADVSRHLTGGDVVVPGGQRRLLSVRSLLLIGQFAASMLFVLVSGVFVAGFLKYSAAETGLGRMDAAAVDAQLWIARPGHDGLRAFLDAVRRRASERGDLYGLAFANALPAGGAAWGNVGVEGPGGTVTRAGGSVIASPGLLDALGIPLLQGRDFTEHDRHDTPRVALVSESAAREWWPSINPLGQRVYYHALGGHYEVVGVTGNTPVRLLDGRSQLVYLPIAQQQAHSLLIIASSRHGPGAAIEGLRQVIYEADADMPLGGARTVRQWMGGFLFRQWLTATATGTLAGLALFLASLGLYGSMAYAVSRRQRELGVRMVLGADAHDIRRLVLWQGFRLVAVGAAIGLYAALLAVETIATITAGVPGTGPGAWLLGPAVMIAVSLLACWLPARRAARVHPIVTLRAL